MSKLIKLLLLSFCLFFVFNGVAIAQEISPEVVEAINLDEDVQPEDLEIGEPRILPDHPLYFLKNWGRSIRLFFAFRPVTKAKLRLKFANEKLMEAKKLIEAKRDPENIKKGIENYQQEIEKTKDQTEKIQEKAKENPEVEKFLNKFIHQQILHQKLLLKLENQVPPEASEKIKEARERHLDGFQNVMLKLEDRKEEITKKLTETLEKQKGSKYKHFKNLEVLLELEEKVPEEAKEAIRKAQENSLTRLREDLEKMSLEDQERFKEYLEKIGGVKERQLEIIENLKSELKERPDIREIMIQIREGIIEKVEEKIGERLEKMPCAQWTPPAPDFCKGGRIVIEKDLETDCSLQPKCIMLGETETPKPSLGVCITLWDPVCGVNGKTYSNACFARVAGAEIAYKGVCKEVECTTDADCPQLRCGPVGTISARCIDVKAKCVEGKCQIQQVAP